MDFMLQQQSVSKKAWKNMFLLGLVQDFQAAGVLFYFKKAAVYVAGKHIFSGGFQVPTSRMA